MSNPDHALKFLLGLESFPSMYEISQAPQEELEERVNNWQEQIFTLAGELFDLQQKYGILKQRNIELEKLDFSLQKRINDALRNVVFNNDQQDPIKKDYTVRGFLLNNRN